MEKTGAVLVMGGGIAGIQASLDLVGMGLRVYLVEQEPSIGGTMAQLDKTFPSNDCSMCILSPKMVEVGLNPNIELLTYSTVESIDGKQGDFRVKVRNKAKCVDWDKCTGCGACAEACPFKVPDLYNTGLSERRVAYIQMPQAVPKRAVIDLENCKHCKKPLCEKACEANAIDHENAEDAFEEFTVGAVIIAPGFDTYDPSGLGFGYGRYPNVVTSLEYERILSSTGPWAGEILRPGDGEHPKKIAFIQCVGSRDARRGHSYCSAVCCTHSLKQSMLTMEHLPGTETTIFNIDLRSYGKGFESYYERAKNMGVRFISNRAPVVFEKKNGDLLLKYENEDGRVNYETFDIVVLAVALEPSGGIKFAAENLGLKRNEHDFIASPPLEPGATSEEGVFACGLALGPRDIPDTVAGASGAAARAAVMLKDVRGTLIKSMEFPNELDVEGKAARIGVYICHCGINIGDVVDCSGVAEYASGLPGVVVSRDVMFSCAQNTQDDIKADIEKYRLNRIVVAACTPRTHEPLFQATMREAGLNPHLFEMANIREHCSWVHPEFPEAATKKSKDLVRMAINKSRRLSPLYRESLEITRGAMVLGGGLAGMTSALAIADMGYPVRLVESSEKLGGILLDKPSTLECDDVPVALESLIKRVSKHPEISVSLNSRLDEISGFVGNFRYGLTDGTEGECGVIVVAVGGVEAKPQGYLYGTEPNVITGKELDSRILAGDLPKGKVTFIQCVEGRNEKRQYCSRLCCTQTVRQARSLVIEGCDVNVIYRDLRAYGFAEDSYLASRQEGVRYFNIPDDPSAMPEVIKDDNGLKLKFYDVGLASEVMMNSDWVILSCAIEPSPESEQVSQKLKVPIDADGFFLEAHVKLRPVDFATDGIFLCGLAHGPKRAEETVAQALGAAARAATVLSHDFMETQAVVAEVDTSICRGCEHCTTVCPVSAIEMEELNDMGYIRRVARVNTALCVGCGTCAGVCLPGAIQQRGFRDRQVLAAVNAISDDIERVDVSCEGLK